MRRWLTPFLAAVVVLALAYAGLWLWAEHELNRGFSRWVQASRSSGWQVASAPPKRGAMPLGASLIITDLSIAGGDDELPGGVAWQAERVVIELSLLHPTVLVIRGEGAERLRFSLLPELPFTAADLRALLPLQLGSLPQRLEIQARNLAAGVAEYGSSPLEIRRLDVHVRWTPPEPTAQPTLGVAMRAADVLLPRAGNWPLGPRLALVSGDAALNGLMPRALSLAERAAAWRDAGGQIKAQRLTLAWGALNLSGNATISLDSSLQPAGSGMARVVDPAQTLNALVAHGVITRRTAFAANAVLALMERLPEGGGSPVVEFPLTIQGRTVSVGNIPLAKIPEIVWSDL